LTTTLTARPAGLPRRTAGNWNAGLDLEARLHQSHFKYNDMADREIVARAQRGENAAAEFMLYKYRNLVRTKVKSYFLVGAEKEDLLQVGQIGLWQAVVDFRSDKAISFPAFAKVCITRHIITAIKTATRQKQMPLNQSLSLESPSDDSVSDWNLSDIIPNVDGEDPEDLMLRSEDTRILHETLQQRLSEFEWHVLSGYQLGKSYREIAFELHCKTKSVDNALARIKRKVADVSIGNADLSELL
jgi:RNA polymerase sporulation-specific sigma factor